MSGSYLKRRVPTLHDVDNTMTRARRPLIRRLYDALTEDEGARESFDAWCQASAELRGPLERKRAVDLGRIGALISLDPTVVDAYKFVFSTELYLALRTNLLVESAVAQYRGDKVSADLIERSLATPLEGFVVDRKSSKLTWAQDILRHASDELRQAEAVTAGALVKACFQGPYHDVLGGEHQALIPRQVRHAMGAFYTPSWLADAALRRLGYIESADISNTTLLDPTVGSGVFLMSAAEIIRRSAEMGSISPTAGLAAMESNLMGIDIDPLAVRQASGNLKLAMLAFAHRFGLDEPSLNTSLVLGDSLGPKDTLPTVELIAGNPPWVNWEYLPSHYRNEKAPLWPELGIYDLAGKDRAFSKEDISALFFASVIDGALKDDGRIAFLLPESLLKSTLNHRGFRRFELRGGSIKISVDHVDDYVAVKPFEGVNNRTVLVTATRGVPTIFPVPYSRWTRVSGPVTNQIPLGEQLVERAEVGLPTDSSDGSAWQTRTKGELDTLWALSGQCPYQARTGVFTGGANAVYHLHALSYSGGLVRVRNITERAKREVDRVEAILEDDHLYPFLRGRDVSQWCYESNALILLPHTAETRMRPISEGVLKRDSPRTYRYLEQFRQVLDDRRGFVAWERGYLRDGFYACQRIGDYTFADWKVVWRYISSTFTSAVIGPQTGPHLTGKPLIANEKLMGVACNSEDEAYYLGGLFGSAPVIAFVESRMISTQISPGIIKGLAIPRFDPTNDRHLQIAAVCREGHRLVRDDQPIANLVDALDDDVAALLNLDAGGVTRIRMQLMS